MNKGQNCFGLGQKKRFIRGRILQLSFTMPNLGQWSKKKGLSIAITLSLLLNSGNVGLEGRTNCYCCWVLCKSP